MRLKVLHEQSAHSVVVAKRYAKRRKHTSHLVAQYAYLVHASGRLTPSARLKIDSRLGACAVRGDVFELARSVYLVVDDVKLYRRHYHAYAVAR